MSIYRAAIELQADRLLACRLESQVEHCVPAEDRAERYLHNSVISEADTPGGDDSRQQNAVTVCMKLVCGAAALELQGVEHFHWLAVLLSTSGERNLPISHLSTAAHVTFLHKIACW